MNITCDRCLEGAHRRCKGRRRCGCTLCTQKATTSLRTRPERTQRQPAGPRRRSGNPNGGPGRKRAYKPELGQLAVRLTAEGLSHTQVARALGLPSRYTVQSILRSARRECLPGLPDSMG